MDPFEAASPESIEDDDTFENFVRYHRTQLELTNIPEIYWESLFQKIKLEQFDAGHFFIRRRILYDDEDSEMDEAEKAARPTYSLHVAHEGGIRKDDGNSIFLIDHCWSFFLQEARKSLLFEDTILDRLCTFAGIDTNDENRVDKLLEGPFWRFCGAYSVHTSRLFANENVPTWYVMDEVGLSILHKDEPNFRCVPFLYTKTGVAFNLLFPLKDCVNNELVTRDIVERVPKSSPQREALLIPWYPKDFRRYACEQTEPPVEYFTTGHVPEDYTLGRFNHIPEIDRRRPLKVFTRYDVLRVFLTSPAFEMANSLEDADILWLTYHFKGFDQLGRDDPNKFINQFPFEYIITIKDLLCVVCRRNAQVHHNRDNMETNPSWLPTTYNLRTELHEFVSYYQRRADKGLDNHWILKPFNLARGMDIHITNNLGNILRVAASGPKVAQKYIVRPVLYARDDVGEVKFDIRYVILLKSVEPLEVYVHRKFFLRFSNKEFSLDNLNDYQKHFTVMNYKDDVDFHHVKCEDFLTEWQGQYPNYSWNSIEDDICAMLYEVFECAIKKPPPCGIGAFAQSRALYGCDIMLEWFETESGERGMRPKLLEINWAPDCLRACKYYEDFFNDIFKFLFLDEANNEIFRLLKPLNINQIAKKGKFA